MTTFANPDADRETANLPGTGVVNLQFFADSVFGLDEADDDDAEGTPEEEESEWTQGGTPEPTATPEKGQSTQVPEDPMARFKNPDGTWKADDLAGELQNVNKERGRLSNELGMTKKQSEQYQRELQQYQTAQNPPEQPDLDTLNAQFVSEFAKNPLQTMANLFQAVGGPMIAPLSQRMAQLDFETEADAWWGAPEHANAPKEKMAEAFKQWGNILAMEHPQNPGMPLIPVNMQLDLLYAIARGESAPQAIAEAAQAAASAASESQAEKAGAQVGASGRAPKPTTGDPILDGMKSVAREGRNIFGI